MMQGIVLELAAAALKATVLLGAAHLVVAALRRSSSALRHLVWVLALGGALLVPLLGVALPWRWELEALPPAAMTGGGERAPDVPAAPAVPAAEIAAAGGRAGGGPAAPFRGSRPDPTAGDWVAPALAALWLAGAAVVLTRLVWGFRMLAGIRRRARPFSAPAWDRELLDASAALEVQPVPLLESDEIEAPLALGLARPFILLPRSAREWSPARARAVLLHELAHVRRHDLATHLLGRLACVVYWFHPLVWQAARRLRNESERACDDLALRAGAVPSSYAADLLEIARVALGHAARNPALAMARPSEFEGRLLAILEPARARLPARRTTVAAASALALGMAVVLAGVAVIPARASHPAPRPELQPPARGMGSADVSEVRRGPDLAGNLILLLRDPEPRVRGAAANALGERRVVAAVPDLVRVLGDPEPRVRARAAYAIGRIKAVGPVPELARLLESDPEPEVRVAAAWALGESGSPRAVHALASAIERSQSSSFRERVVDALGETGHAAALPVLEGLLTERDGRIREAALEAVAEIGTPAAEAVLVRAMQNPDARLRSMAADALGGRR